MQLNAEKRMIAVYDPTAEPVKKEDALAMRLPSLDGKVIGLLNNTKDLVDEMLGEVEHLLRTDYPNAEFKRFRKRSVSGMDADLLEQVAKCDVVITAVGD